jgi:transposase InsO family protein
LFIRASLEAGGVEATSSKEEIRMRLHGNHRTCPSSRRLICERVIERGWSVRQAAEAAGCSERTAAKWLRRYRDGDQLLSDRSSRPRRSPARLAPDRVDAIERLRRVRMTASEIAEVLGLPLSTVSLWLKRIGLGKRSRLEPPEPPNRYERRHPGELVHVDLKQLGRISPRGAGHRAVGHRKSQYRPQRDGRKHSLTGFEYLHVIIDDHSRLAYAEILKTLTATDAAAFIRRAIAWYAARGVHIRAVMTDNGSAYISHLYARTLRELGLRHLRIQPNRPRTNGKAERLIQTLLNEWAYARIYGSSNERTAALPLYLDRYNYRRPHGSLGHQPPATRLNNLVRNYT